VGQNPNTRLINFDWNEPMKSLRVQVDQDRVRQLGVSSKSLAEALNAVTTGMVITSGPGLDLSDRFGGSVTRRATRVAADIEKSSGGAGSAECLALVMVFRW
jgi:hypothetical protein